MNDARSVVVFGSLNMDLSVACARMPQAGETLSGGDLVTNAGGKGANQAVAAARMGARTHMIGAVGADAFGEALVAGLAEAGVDTAHVESRADVATGTAVIIRYEGDNRIILSPGANVARDPADVERALDALIDAGCAPQGSIFIAQGECRLETTAAALIHARRRGLYTVFNPAPACRLPSADAWRAVDLICPNETECAAITGIAPVDDASCAAALDALRGLTQGAALITLGGAGAVLSVDGTVQRIPAQRVEAVDTTAAGDTFIGALAATYGAGASLHDAAVQASRAAALAVTRVGAQQSIPTYDEVAAWERAH